MAQKSRVPQQPLKSQEIVLSEIDVVPNERAMPNMRFAFGVWFLVFALLAGSIFWDSIYGLLFRTPTPAGGRSHPRSAYSLGIASLTCRATKGVEFGV